MVVRQHSLPNALTRGQWFKVLSYYQGCPVWPYRRERRSFERNRIPALVTLSFKSASNNEKQTVYSNCRVMDASTEGLAVCTIRKIVPGTLLSIEVKVGDRRFMLMGRVRHSTGFPGSSVRVGVLLEFAETAGDKEMSSDIPGTAGGA